MISKLYIALFVVLLIVGYWVVGALSGLGKGSERPAEPRPVTSLRQGHQDAPPPR